MSGFVDGTRRHVRMRCLLALACAAALALSLALVLSGCGKRNSTETTSSATPTVSAQASDDKVQTFTPSSGSASTTLKIASGSENKEAAAAIQKAVDDSGVAVELHYMGSLDIMGQLENGGGDYDAVWPASSIWISMGDTKHLVQDAQSTSTTPVVLGVRKSKAVELGWADDSGNAKSVSTSDVIAAVNSGSFTFSMTSATQSNSGASAYLAFLTALSGSNSALTAADLQDQSLQAQVKTLLSGVDRSSGSSDWLKEMCVDDPDAHDAMINYESLVIAADKELDAAGKDPYIAIYLSDGIAVSDSPLGYVDRGQGDDRKSAFDSFQSALASDDAKLLLEQAGRRCGVGGRVAHADDATVADAFRSSWGIDTSADALKTITVPSADVIKQALTIYQTALRKPSYTIWVVDYSGSMWGSGKDGVVQGLKEALDPTLSAQAMIEPAADDVNVFIPFNKTAQDPVTVTGTATQPILDAAQSTEADGGTDIYAGLERALPLAVSAEKTGNYTVAIALMTDGQSMTSNQKTFTNDYNSANTDVPIFSIMFASADPNQLKSLAELSNGKVFDGRSEDLATVFRTVKGYN